MTRVLVTYATKHNATAEIAQAIGEGLRQSNQLQVDVEPVELIKDLSPYEAVVLGSAVYGGQWQPEAANFLKAHEQELAQRAVWLFSSGPVGEGDPRTLMKGWMFPENLQPFADCIKPRDIALFHGKLETETLSFLERTAIRVVGASKGDYRDWNMIRHWTEKITAELAPT